MSVEELMAAIHRSATELRLHRRPPVRVRMHPMDIEVLRARYLPDADPLAWDTAKVIGVAVVGDENVRRGEPVAEFEALPRERGSE